MAPRHGRPDNQLKQRIEKRTDNIVLVSAIAGLAVCGAINALVLIVSPEATRPPVPEPVFYGLIIVLAPDFFDRIRGGRS